MQLATLPRNHKALYNEDSPVQKGTALILLQRADSGNSFHKSLSKQFHVFSLSSYVACLP